MLRAKKVPPGTNPGAGQKPAPGDAEVGASLKTPTPGKPGNDADLQAQITDLEAKLDSVTAKAEKDVAGIKSASDKRFQTLQDTARNNESALRAQIDELRTADMDDTERTQYEKSRLEGDVVDLRKKIEELQTQSERSGLYNQWNSYFSGLGIDTSTLDSSNVEAFIQSGLSITAEMVTGKQDTLGADTSDKKNLDPPPVDTSLKSGVASGKTYRDLVKEYADGNEEEFMMMVQHNRIPQEVLADAIGPTIDEE